MKQNKRIGIDLDGVVYDLIGEFDKMLISKGIEPNLFQYSRGLSPSQVHEYLEEFSWGHPFLTIPTYPNAINSINELNKTLDVYLITHRDWCDYGIADTIRRLHDDKVKFTDLIFSPNKGSEAKKFNIDYFVEDNLENARYITKLSNSKVFLIDREYNKSKDLKGIRRVKDLSRVVEILK